MARINPAAVIATALLAFGQEASAQGYDREEAADRAAFGPRGLSAWETFVGTHRYMFGTTLGCPSGCSSGTGNHPNNGVTPPPPPAPPSPPPNTFGGNGDGGFDPIHDFNLAENDVVRITITEVVDIASEVDNSLVQGVNSHGSLLIQVVEDFDAANGFRAATIATIVGGGEPDRG
jgi:hypothetical protein